MYQSGVTPEGLRVIAGVGKISFTNGVPLEVLLGFFKEKDLVVDWTDYIMSALLDGHNPRTIRSRMESAIQDIHGAQYASEVMVKADSVLDWLTNPPPEPMKER